MSGEVLRGGIANTIPFTAPSFLWLPFRGEVAVPPASAPAEDLSEGLSSSLLSTRKRRCFYLSLSSLTTTIWFAVTPLSAVFWPESHVTVMSAEDAATKANK